MEPKSDWVTATEIATYAYCAEAWRLSHGLKKSPHNQRQLKRGRTQHENWQAVERSTSRLIWYALLFAAFAAGLFLLRVVLV